MLPYPELRRCLEEVGTIINTAPGSFSLWLWPTLVWAKLSNCVCRCSKHLLEGHSRGFEHAAIKTGMHRSGRSDLFFIAIHGCDCRSQQTQLAREMLLISSSIHDALSIMRCKLCFLYSNCPLEENWSNTYVTFFSWHSSEATRAH